MRFVLAAAVVLAALPALAEDAPPAQQQSGPCTFGQGGVKMMIAGVDPEVTVCQMALLRVDLSQAMSEKAAAGALKLKADAEAKAATARADDLQKLLEWYKEDDSGLRAQVKP